MKKAIKLPHMTPYQISLVEVVLYKMKLFETWLIHKNKYGYVGYKK